MDEARTLRNRLDGLAADRPPPADSGATGTRIVKTITVTTYPTVAGSAYAVQAQTVDVTETEGATPTFANVTGTFYAVNLGTNIPPSGTVLLIQKSGDRWVFVY